MSKSRSTLQKALNGKKNPCYVSISIKKIEINLHIGKTLSIYMELLTLLSIWDVAGTQETLHLSLNFMRIICYSSDQENKTILTIFNKQTNKSY